LLTWCRKEQRELIVTLAHEEGRPERFLFGTEVMETTK
jgi:hypothetical protein